MKLVHKQIQSTKHCNIIYPNKYKEVFMGCIMDGGNEMDIK
jgi:hypothetical protein